MKCPFCNQRTEIYNSRPSHKATQTWRRRQCTSCKNNFTTREKIDWSGHAIVREGATKTPYSSARLLLSIARASEGATIAPEMISELTDGIEQALQRDFSPPSGCDAETITQVALRVLSGYNKLIALRYAQHVYQNQPPLELVQKITAAN